jgi:hypothetical protein
MSEGLRIGGYNARRGLVTARRLIAKIKQLYLKTIDVTSEKHRDPVLTAQLSKIGALAEGVDALIEASLRGEDVSDESLALYAELLQEDNQKKTRTAATRQGRSAKD